MQKPEQPRDRQFHILNVKLRRISDNKDLESEDYIRVFKKILSKRVHAESSNGKHCIFRFMFEEKNEKDKLIFLKGTFARFTYIENERWFNLTTLDIDDEFKLPDGLFPDAVITEFVFIPDAHRFCYLVSSGMSMAPLTIKKFLEKAIDQVCEKNEFVQVDIETDRSSIEKILSANQIKKLYIDINFSNGDFAKHAKKFVDDDIRASNPSRLELKVTQKPNTGIEVKKSQIIAGALENTISNGSAEATIIDDNHKTVKIKTSDFPRKERVFGIASRFPDQVYEKIMNIFRSDANKPNN